MKKERVRVRLENSEDGEECKLREFLLEDLFFLENTAALSFMRVFKSYLQRSGSV